MKYDVWVDVKIPVCMNGVEAFSCDQAARLTAELLKESLPLWVTENVERIQKEMTVEFRDINEVVE